MESVAGRKRGSSFLTRLDMLWLLFSIHNCPLFLLGKRPPDGSEGSLPARGRQFFASVEPSSPVQVLFRQKHLVGVLRGQPLTWPVLRALQGRG